MTRATVALFLSLSSAVALADLWGTLEPGGHVPGFRTINLVDDFRAADGRESPEGRPLQISVWYPAAPPADEAAEAMRIADYVHLTAREHSVGTEPISASEAAAAEATVAAFPLETVDEAALRQMLGLAGRAIPDARPAGATYPALVILPGNHDPAWRHFVLAEYLASHGYVVAAIPSASRRVRAAMEMSFGYGPFRDQMNDAAFAIDFMRAEDPQVDPARVMLFGFSIGGNTGGNNLLRDRDVAGFVCLDCGIGSTWGTPYLNEVREKTFPSAARRRLAILHISKGGERNDDSFIDGFEAATAYHSIVDDALHFNFTSLGAVAAEIPAIRHEQWLASGRFARQVHDQSVHRVRLFLDAHLKDDANAGTALERTDPGERVHFHRISRPRSADVGK